MAPHVGSPLTLEHALLGFLLQRPMHAYEMYRVLARAGDLGHVWHLKQSRLYALPARLEEAGYAVGTSESRGARPPRKVLAPTAAGRFAFDRWLRTPVAHCRDFRLEFLAKLHFAREAGPETVARLIAEQCRACQAWLADLRDQAIRADYPYDWLALEFQCNQATAILAWLDTCVVPLVSPCLAVATDNA